MATTPIHNLLDLSSKVAIVTGGASGIGRQICVRLAEAGASILVVDVNASGAEETATLLKSSGQKAEQIVADISNVSLAEEVVDCALAKFGTVDILVNCAGIYPLCPLLEITEDLYEKVMGVNVKGNLFLSIAFSKSLIKAGKGGKIVNISSIDAFRPSGSLTVYNASKASVAMMTKSMAKELAEHNITVNAVAPGVCDTPGVFKPDDPNKESIVKMVSENIPLGRFAQPDDIAKMVLSICSEMSSFMTGSTVLVDGGMLLK